MEKKRVLAILLALCLMLVFVPADRANAADYAPGLWLRQIPHGEGVTIAVCADSIVASGVITITYNQEVLAFQELKLEDQYVAYHAINAEDAGVIKISWIGTGAEPDAKGHVLMWLEFTGSAELSAVMSGTVYEASGSKLTITTLNETGVTAAIMQAETLQAEDYTVDSFAAVTAAVENANALLEQVAVTQSQLDAAAEALNVAMECLVYVPEPGPDPDPTDPTDPTQPTDPAPTDPQPTEPAPTESKPAETKPTQPQTTQPNNQQNQDEVNVLLIPILVGCCVPIVVAVVLLKKKGAK